MRYILFLALLCMIFSPVVTAQWDDLLGNDEEMGSPQIEGDWITMTGEGELKKLAAMDACQKAMMRMVEDNVDRKIFNRLGKKIQRNVEKNWKKYLDTSIPPKVIKSYDGYEIKIRMKLRREKLLGDVSYWTTELEKKFRGIEFAVQLDLAGRTLAEDQIARKRVLLRKLVAKVEDKLGADFVIRDEIQAEIYRRDIDTKALDINYAVKKADLIWQQYADVKAIIYLWVNTYKRQGPYGEEFWYAEIEARGIQRFQNQQILHFEITSADKNRNMAERITKEMGSDKAEEMAVTRLGEELAAKLKRQLKNRMTIQPENVYTIRFIHVNSISDREVLDKVMADLERQRIVSSYQAPSIAGNDLSYRVKFVQGKQGRIKGIIRGMCKLKGFPVMMKNETTSMIIFQPRSKAAYEEDEDSD